METRGQISELLVDDADMDAPTRIEFAGIINGEAERLSRLVNNLLDLSRMEADAVDWRLEPVDLAAELNRVVVSQLPVAQKKGINVRLGLADAAPQVIADHDGLHQVLLNLVGNAIKFTEVGEVAVSAAAHGSLVEVSVTDSGPGISDTDRDLIFERFYQVGNPLTDKPSGTGLGLAICQKILEHHGSEIRLTSELGKGSRFSFELQAAPRPMPSGSGGLAAATSTGGFNGRDQF